MLKTVGIVVEYNPLHNGHVYHCLQSRKLSGADAVVAVMSGHFLQRGEPAIVDKWARAEMALHAGVDLVLELPVAYSAQPAEWFAYGAVHALDASGIVDSVCFGSEHGDIDWFLRMADRLAEEPPEFRNVLRHRLKLGIPYPKAYAEAAAQLWTEEVDEERMSQPNNTLGLHYAIALRRLGSPMRALTVPRTKAGYHDPVATDERIASATAIRRMLSVAGEGPGEALASIRPYVPAATFAILKREFEAGRGPVRWDDLLQPLLTKIVTSSAEHLVDIAEVAEGLEHRLKQAPGRMAEWTFEDLIGALETKRYTRTKLQRTLLRVLLDHRKHELDRRHLSRGVPGLRVLGFTERGRMLLRRMKHAAKVPIWTSIGREEAAPARLNVEAGAVYAAALKAASPELLRREFTQQPIYLPDSADFRK